MAALGLLGAVQENPNLDPEFRALAMETANTAIYVATQALANPEVGGGVVAEAIPSTPDLPVTPVVSVPTQLKVRANEKYSAGANCQSVDFYAIVLDQYGNRMAGQPVTMVAPSYTITENTTLSSTDGNGVYEARLRYTPQSKNTKETVTFTSGSLTATSEITIGEGPKSHQIKNSQNDGLGSWYEITAGLKVDPVTLMCL